MSKHTKAAKQFWKLQKKYPHYSFAKEHRLYELNYLIPNLSTTVSFLDIGCGDCALIKCLQQLTDIKEYHGYDISTTFMRGMKKTVITKEYDITKPTALPKTDITLLSNVIQYIFSDKQLIALLSKIKSDTVYLQTACTLNKDDEIISEQFEQAKGMHTAKYRTVENTLSLLRQKFKVMDMVRIYPDSIECEFGTKHYYFELIKL